MKLWAIDKAIPLKLRVTAACDQQKICVDDNIISEPVEEECVEVEVQNGRKLVPCCLPALAAPSAGPAWDCL